MRMITRSSTCVLALVCASMAVSAKAQTAPQTSAPEPLAEGATQEVPTGVEDIIVTAQRRAQNLQETALSISSVNGEALADRQIVDVLGLSQTTAGVNIGTSLGIVRIAIRGISYDTLTQGGESRAAFHVDGVYVSRPPAQLAAFFDVDRVEVLRGPQGTLYGRNATAGAINVITGSPGDTFGGYARGTLGSHNLVRAEGALDLPISEGVRGRIAFQTQDRDGYGSNLATGGEVDDLQTRAVRAKLALDLTPSLSLDLSGDYFHQDDFSGGYHYFGPGHENPAIQPIGVRFGNGAFATNPYDTAAEYSGNTKEIYGFAADMTWDLGSVQFVSLTGYRSSKTLLRTDLDGTPSRLTEANVREDSEQFSQELRLQGDFAFGNFIVGAYAFDEQVSGFNAVPFDRVILGLTPQFSPGFYQGGSLDTRAYAVFGQADFDLTDRLTLTLGGRYSSERKTIDEQFQLDSTRVFFPGIPVVPLRAQVATKEWSGFTPKVSLDYAFSDDVFGYVSYSQGFKSGGFNLGGVQPPFNQETITAYETGIRTDLLQNRLRANFSAFYYDYKDIQVTRLLNNISSAENAAAAELYGLEAEIIAVPTDNLQFDLNASFMRARFNEFLSADAAQPSRGTIDLAGNRLQQAPEYSINAGVQYSAPMQGGTLTARLDGNFVGKVYFSAFNREALSQDASARFDGLVKFASDQNWTVSGFVKNITNEVDAAYAVVGAGIFGFGITGSYQPPRTYGLTVEFKF